MSTLTGLLFTPTPDPDDDVKARSGLFVKLVNQDTSETVTSTSASVDGTFSVTRPSPGTYYVSTSPDGTTWTAIGTQEVAPANADILHTAGNETASGIKEFSSDIFFRSGRPWVDVGSPQWGIDLTGATDSTAGLQAALNAGAGGEIKFPAWGKILTKDLTVKGNNTILRGGRIGWYYTSSDGAGGCELIANTGTGTVLSVTQTSGDGCAVIEGISFNGNGRAAHAVSLGDGVNQGAETRLCLFYGFTSDALLHAGHNYGSAVRFNIFRNNAGYGIVLGLANHAVEIVGNTFYENAGDIDIGRGASSIPPSCVWIHHNNFNGCQQAGSTNVPSVNHEYGKSYIDHNYFEGTNVGISNPSIFEFIHVNDTSSYGHCEISSNRFNHQAVVQNAITVVQVESLIVRENQWEDIVGGYFLNVSGMTVSGYSGAYDNYGTQAVECNSYTPWSYFRSVGTGSYGKGGLMTPLAATAQSSTSIWQSARISSDTFNRFQVNGSGKLQWGTGAASPSAGIQFQGTAKVGTDGGTDWQLGRGLMPSNFGAVQTGNIYASPLGSTLPTSGQGANGDNVINTTNPGGYAIAYKAGGAWFWANGTVYTPSLAPTAVAANTTAEQTFTVTGLTVGQTVVVNGPSPTAGTGVVAHRVSAANALAITFLNATSGSLTPAAGTYTVRAT